MIGRIHKIIENQIDLFIILCNDFLLQQHFNKILAKKDIESSVIYIGDFSYNVCSPKFGFIISYEQILDNSNAAFEEFKFKVLHFSKNSDRFESFRREIENENGDKI
jgi:hypothetical protein